jgi:transposase
MDVVEARCAGIDVHQAQVTVCVLRGEPGKKVQKEIRVFETFTGTLLALAAWLQEQGVTAVAMESTGVYWKPVYAVLESVGAFSLVVGNAQHIKNVPGRKTDVKDAQWIADLLRHGLIKKSFVPPAEFRQLRELTRYRKSMVQTRTAERNRLQKLLESANVKLGSVVTDVFGMTGMAILRALVKGEAQPEELAQLACGNLRAKKAALKRATECRIEEHHRTLLKLQLAQVAHLDTVVEALDVEIERRLEPYRKQLELLCTIPGVGKAGAATILAEMGADMSVFPTVGQFTAWAGVCPSNNESAGKRHATRTRNGNPYLRTALVEAATSAVRTKGTFFRDKYFRMGSRMPRKKAKVAIAHKLAAAAYAMLKANQPFKELGPDYLDTLHSKRRRQKLQRQAAELGLALVPVAPMASQPSTLNC